MFIVLKKSRLTLFVLAVFMFLLLIYNFSFEKESRVFKTKAPLSERIVVIDPGHGGYDAGAMSKNKVLEKNINLEIARALAKELSNFGIKTVFTRDGDYALNEDGATRKKLSDLNKRKEIINNADADLMVSIHLNMFEQSKYKGAQIFYETQFEDSKILAELIQKRIKSDLDSENNRESAKISSDKYLFKNLKLPAILVECGFLSNEEEEKKLNTPEYQEKLAKVVCSGIIDYFSMRQIDLASIPSPSPQ